MNQSYKSLKNTSQPCSKNVKSANTSHAVTGCRSPVTAVAAVAAVTVAATVATVSRCRVSGSARATKSGGAPVTSVTSRTQVEQEIIEFAHSRTPPPRVEMMSERFRPVVVSRAAVEPGGGPQRLQLQRVRREEKKQT